MPTKFPVSQSPEFTAVDFKAGVFIRNPSILIILDFHSKTLLEDINYVKKTWRMSCLPHHFRQSNRFWATSIRFQSPEFPQGAETVGQPTCRCEEAGVAGMLVIKDFELINEHALLDSVETCKTCLEST